MGKQNDEILTEELLNELLFSSSTENNLETHETTRMSLAAYLNDLLNEKNLRKSAVIKASRLNETFAYQIFAGKRHPSRNKVLQLAFAMKLDLRETQRLLWHAGVNELYCKNRRDAVIIFYLSHDESLDAVDAQLYKFDEETITEA